MFRRYSSIIVIVLLSLAPVVIWLFLEPLSEHFGSLVLFFSSLGEVSALVGMVLFSLNIVISTRLQIFEKIFGGLNRVYVIHHTLGATAFIFLLFHPLFLLSRTLAFSFSASSRFLLPEGYLAKDLGIYSLGLMIVILILTFFVGMKYEFWKGSHKFLGAAFFLGALHSFMIPSDISQSLVLRYYMLFIVSLGGTAYIYRTILGKWTTRKYLYEIVGKKMLMDNIIDFTFKTKNKAMPYRAGQFVFISFNNRYLPREIHPFSISSGERGDVFKLTIKILGDYTASLKNVKIGDTAVVEGPFGRFGYDNFKNKKQVWLGAGIGVAPFIGMLEELAKNRGEGYDVDFYYCTKDMIEQNAIKDLMEKMKSLDKFSFIPHCSTEHGWINAGFISSHSKDFKERDFLVCGPPSLMKSIRKQLRDAGVRNNKIHTEEFSF
jgi:predicted ferric reductase